MVDDEAVILKDVLDCQLVELKGKTWGLSFQVTTKDPNGHPRCVDLTSRRMTTESYELTAPPDTLSHSIVCHFSFAVVWDCRAEHDTTLRFRRRRVYT